MYILHKVLLWLGYSKVIEGISTNVRGKTSVRKFYISDSTQDSIPHIDTTSYISSCWCAKKSESQLSHNSICVSNFCREGKQKILDQIILSFIWK